MTDLDQFIEQLEDLRDEHGNVPVVEAFDFPARASYDFGKVWVTR